MGTVGRQTDINFPATGLLNLRVAFETQVWVALDQHFPVHRAVWSVTDRAAFAESFMLENKRSCLFPMTLSAILIEAGHGQSARGLEDVRAVRIMALDAIHAVFNYRMMLRKVEFGMCLQMAIETCRRVFARVYDELATPAPGGDMFAAGAVA